MQKGDSYSLEAVKTLKKENGDLYDEINLIADVKCICRTQKGTQFHGGDYVRADEEGEFYRGIVVLMIHGVLYTRSGHYT